MQGLHLNILIPSLILVAAMVDDIWTRKVHNWLFLVCLCVALAYTLWQQNSWLDAGGGALTALLVTLPMVWIKALGAGDMKIFIAFGVATNSTVVLSVILFALVWGAFLGVIRSLLSKEGKALLQNVFALVKMQKPQLLKMHSIPFTVALFFGWISYHITQRYGGVL